MHGKPAGYYDGGNLPGMKMEETIRKWLEDKFENFELVERDLKKHVRTFVGIFKLSRQDLVQDIRDEPQYPLEVQRYTDGQHSLEDLRKSVFVFELMKLTCLEKEEADQIVDELFAEWNLITLANLKEEKEELLQRRPLSQPASRSEPVSRSDLEMSYTSAFPALPPKGNKPKVPSEPIPSFWEQRSPLRCNPSVQSSKNKIGSQDSLSEKAPTLVNKKIRTGGKENECGPASFEPKKRIGRSRDLRSRRESSYSSSQSPKSLESQQYLDDLSKAIKSCIGMNGSNQEASAESSKKNEMQSQEPPFQESPSEDKDWLNLNPFCKQKQSVWGRDYVTEHPWWSSYWYATQSQRPASEPHFSRQEMRMECAPPKKVTTTPSERLSSLPTPVQSADPSIVEYPSSSLPQSSDGHILEGLLSTGLSESLFDLDLHAVNPPGSSCEISIHSDLFLSDSIWSKNHISKEEWPSSTLDNPSSQSRSLQPATFSSQVQEEPGEPEKVSCACPSDVVHSSCAAKQSDSQAAKDCWWHHQVDSSYESDEGEASISSDSDSWKLQPQETLSFSFVDKSSVAQEQLILASASDFPVSEQQPAALAMEKDCQDTLCNATSPTVIERAVDQIFPPHISDHQHDDQEFLSDIPFSDHAGPHNLLPSMNCESFTTSSVPAIVPEYSLFDYTSDYYKQQITSGLSHQSLFYQQSYNTPMPFYSQPHSLSSHEGSAHHPDHSQPEPYSRSFIWLQPFQSGYSVEDVRYKLLSWHSVFAVPFHHPVMVEYPQESEKDIDHLGIRTFASMLEDGCQKNWEECLKEPQSAFMENDLSYSPDLNRCNSLAFNNQQDFCSCKGACNCLSVLPVKFSWGYEEVASDVVHLYKHQRASYGSVQAPQSVMKIASENKLDHEPLHKSAFRKVSSTSYPTLVSWPGLTQLLRCFDITSGPRTTPTCLIQNASEYQLEKIKKNCLRVIKPESMKQEEPEEVAVPDLSFLDHPDVYGNRLDKLKAMPSYLFKESKETQTSHGDDESGSTVFPSIAAKQPPKPVYEEKHWKDLMPLSAEDMQRDLLHAAISAQKEGIAPSDFLDVAALEGYDFADYQLLLESETSASLHVPQNRAVYVKDLEKAWLSESYRRLGKNKVRRPLHPNKPCSFYLEGCCYRFDCKFSHDIDTITCQFWEVGQCFKGDLCPFLHGYFGGFSISDGGEEFDVTKEDFPELTRKDVRLNSAPASKKRRNKKSSVHRLQLQRGT